MKKQTKKKLYTEKQVNEKLKMCQNVWYNQGKKDMQKEIRDSIFKVLGIEEQ